MQDHFELIKEYQVISALIGLIILLLIEHLHPFFDYHKKSLRNKGIHVFRNLLIGAINAILLTTLFAGLWVLASVWADENSFGLLHLLDLPIWARIIIGIILLDFWMYIWHWMNHKIPFFWRFHLVHHSDSKMDVTTASRFHVGEIIFSSLLRIPVILLLGVYAWELLLYEAFMFSVVQFHHADIRLPRPVDRFLRLIIVTPDMHKIHHSRWQPETDSNYGSLFSFWDRIVKTFTMREDIENLNLGLDGYDEPEDESITGIFKMPIKKTKDQID